MTDEQKKGKVYVHTSEGVFPYSKLQESEAEDSKQLKEKNKWVTDNSLINPPYPPEVLLTLHESNPIFWSCVNQLAIDVAGLGWNLQLRENQKDNEKEKERLNEFLKTSGKEESFRNIIKQALIDWGSIGYFGLEVVRNNAGEVSNVYYLPAHTLRVHESNEKYAQIRNNKKVWFKKFGIEEDINSETGKPEGVIPENKAHELIFYKNFYPKSNYYGVTNAISAIGDIVGMIGLRDYNLAFFENYGIPAGLITLKGDWEEGADKKIAQFLNKEAKGNSNAHKTLVLTQPEGCDFEYEKLSVEVKDGSFKVYGQTSREDIMIAFSMPAERIGVRIVGKLGGNVAEEATKIYIQSVVEPLQTDMEDIINDNLLNSGIYEFKFTNIDTRDIDVLIKQHGFQIERGTMTPNESRNILGRKPYQDGDKFYMMSSLIEIGEPEEPLSKSEITDDDNDN